MHSITHEEHSLTPTYINEKYKDHFYEIMIVETLKLYFWNAHNLLIPNMFIRNFKHQFLKFDRKIRPPLRIRR